MSLGGTSLNLHTLGPEGTNCAEAARFWLSRSSPAARSAEDRIVLHPTLELASLELADPERDRLLSCAAYPELHTFIFSRLDRLVMTDAFVMPTHAMVLARQQTVAPDSGRAPVIATHPAPRHLAESCAAEGAEFIAATSNADAAVRCAKGEADICVTTTAAARIYDLAVLQDFGPVPMAFLIHAMLP